MSSRRSIYAARQYGARPLARLMVLALVCLGVAFSGRLAAQDDRRPVRPPTKQTQAITAAVFRDLDAAQQAIDAKDYSTALAALGRLKARQERLNDYERATLYNLYAIVHYNQDNTPAAIQAYQDVLRQPNLPEGLRDSTLFALAQMYFVTEQYPLAVRVLDRWFELAPAPSADAYILLAQAYYQQAQYAAAETHILSALRVARERGIAARENWLGLLRAVYYELGQYDRAARVLEFLVAQYPSQSYYLQLSGMYGLLGNQRAQLATLHAAYLAGMLDKEADILNLARLYLVEEAPHPAAETLARAFRDRLIEVNAENLQLYAQALSLAQEQEAQIPVLKRLAEMSGEARHYTFLGQALTELGRWDEAIEAFSDALQAKELADAASVRMQLGTAQFNAGRLADARRSFIAASASERHAETAGNWIKFVGAEIERQRAINTLPQQPTPETEEQSQVDESASA